MRKDLTWRNAFLVVLAFGLSFGLGSYLYTQQQEVSNLQQQIDQLPDGKDKVALVKDSLVLKNTIAVGVVQAVGGLLLFVTVYVSLQNLKATQRNVLVAEEKQVTERFTQAINQLGSEKITVRVGGIYALERISKDSEKDYWTIVEVLTSFVREPLQSDSGQLVEPLTKITKDVQAALTVLMRRDLQQDPKNRILDLTEANLSGADLSGANLSGANLDSVDLSGANLSGVNLNFANLNNANLHSVSLIGASLIRAHLIHANLSSANLSSANLLGACLNNADLSRAYLNNADLSRADLLFADLNEANLRGAKLNLQQVEAAKNFKQAKYDDDFSQKLGLPSEPRP